MCEEAVARNPKDVNMTALLGAILFKMRRGKDSEAALREAIRLAPSFAKPHEDLGMLLVHQRRPQEAVEILQKATRLDPKVDNSWLNLGKALAMLGRGKEADEAFEKSFDLNPERKMLALAAEHHKEGRMAEAERLYREVLSSNPDNVDALRFMGMIAYGAGKLEEAAHIFQRVVDQAPDFVAALIDLGRTLKDLSRFEDAINCFKNVVRLEPENAKGHYLLAGTLSPAALNYEAIESFQRALELRPDHAGAWLGLGHALKTVGRQEEAIDAYRECIRLKPDSGPTYWSLANLKTYKLSDDDIEIMVEKLEQGGLSDESEVNFLFALAKAHEDRGDYEAAWKYYEQGNTTRRALESYDPVRTETLIDSIIEVFDQPLLEANTGLGNPDPAPIFIIGLPRSGSTLLEQILASHSQVEGTSELPYIGQVSSSLNRNPRDGVNYPEAVRELGAEHFQALGQDYLQKAQMHRTEGAAFFIDKMPNNYPSVGFMHLILPNAKIIDARRYPLDSCLSCYRQLFGRGQSFTYDLTDIGEYFLQYQRAMDHWHEVMPGRVLTIQYEEVVTDFENQVRRLLEYCGLPFEEACLRYYETERPVRTASSEQVRQPVYSKSVHFWRNHESQLGELIEVLEPVLPRYSQYESINT
jgi:tetratricopeptide (TPR) repeat protein